MYQIRSVHCPAGEETLTVTSEEDSDSYVEGISAQLPDSPSPIGDALQSANRQQTPYLHCDSRYYLYEIFMPYVFKMSIAIH